MQNAGHPCGAPPYYALVRPNTPPPSKSTILGNCSQSTARRSHSRTCLLRARYHDLELARGTCYTLGLARKTGVSHPVVEWRLLSVMPQNSAGDEALRRNAYARAATRFFISAFFRSSCLRREDVACELA